MSKNIFIIASCVLIFLGIFLPSWYIALPGLMILSVLIPAAGIGVGFVYDIYFGASPILPSLINYPFMLLALVLGILSLFLRDYLR